MINFAVDAHWLSFSDLPDGKKKAVIECAVRVFSAKMPEEPFKTEAETIDANLPLAAYAKVLQAGLPCSVAMYLPAGDYLLRLGVRDNNTGLIGTTNAQIKVPATPAEQTR